MKKLLILIALLVLSYVNYANAADAWILWNKASSSHPLLYKDRKHWSVKSSFDDKKQCVASLESEANDATELWRHLKTQDGRPASNIEVNVKDTKGTAIILILDKDGSIFNSIIEEFLCLPDTIDPRNK